MTSDATGLTHLGKISPIEHDPLKVKLDYFRNPHPDQLYAVRFSIPEFQSLCPATGQPDVATIVIDYVPDIFMVESKSLKLYMFAFRNHGAFHEDVTVTIGKRLETEMRPVWIRVAGFFNARGGISIDTVWESGDLPRTVQPLSIDTFRPYHNRM